MDGTFERKERITITGKRGKVSSVSNSSNGDRANKRQKKNADKNIASRTAALQHLNRLLRLPMELSLSHSWSREKKRRHILKIGTRVYAEWPKPKGWHFATVMDIKRKAQVSRTTSTR